LEASVIHFVSDSKDCRRRWSTPIVVAAMLAALTSGCGPGSSDDDASGGHGGTGHGDEVPAAALPSRPSEPMTIQQLAAGLGCDLNLAEGKRQGFRQGTCQVNGKHTILVDFDTDTGQRDWLELSSHHSGVYYLVGERWILTAYTLEAISPLQDKFGGKIERGHSAPPPDAESPR
jgi:hypothetical protein